MYSVVLNGYVIKDGFTTELEAVHWLESQDIDGDLDSFLIQPENWELDNSPFTNVGA